MANVVRYQLRSDTTENWESANPVLLRGELGLDLTANRLKIGDGITAWVELRYTEPSMTELQRNFMQEDGRTVSKKVYVDDSGASGGGDDPPNPNPNPSPTPNPNPLPVDLTLSDWEVIEMPTTLIGGAGFVDYGAETGKLMFSDNRWSYIYDAGSGECEDFYNYRPSNASGEENDEEGGDENNNIENVGAGAYETYYDSYPEVDGMSYDMVMDIDPQSKTVLNSSKRYIRHSLETEFEHTVRNAENLPSVASPEAYYAITRRAMCWYPARNSFCRAGDIQIDRDGVSNVYPYSELVSADGMLYDRHRTASASTGSLSHYCNIVYSSIRGELLGISHREAGKKLRIRKSLDGLNWERYIPEGIMELTDEQPYSLCRSDSMGYYFLATQNDGASSSDRETRIYRSPDGLEWEQIYSLPYKTSYIYSGYPHLAASEEYGVLCLIVNRWSSSTSKIRLVGYLTQDMETWHEYDSGDENEYKRISGRACNVKWSETLRSFVCCVKETKAGVSRNPMRLKLFP